MIRCRNSFDTFLILLFSGLLSFISSCATTTTTAPEERHILQGNEFVKDGLLREARQAYRQALKLSPKNSIATRNLGLVELKMKNYKVGTSLLESVMDRFEADFDSNFWLAEGYRSMDRFADAIYRYKKALDIRPQEPRSTKSLAWSYYKIRYYSEAINVLKPVLSKYEDDPQMSVILARILIKMDQSKQAITVLNKAKAHVKEDGLPYLQSVEGDAYLAQSSCGEATKLYQSALKAQPLLPGPLLGLAKCYLSVGKSSQALTYLERAVRIKPTFTEAVLLLAQNYEKTDAKKAVRYYRAFRKLAIKDPEFTDQLGDAKAKIARLSPTPAPSNSSSKRSR